MAALRLPQHLAEPAHVDSGEAHLRFDLLEKLDAAVGHAERDVEAAMAALHRHDAAGGDPAARKRLVESAAEAVWRLLVQHEASDCADHSQLIARYRIPGEVLARVGAH